ncbi:MULTISPECIES: cold shock small protein YmcF [Enterobacteriaceae]|uniref:cold shock small protein YmcF n=1 Tax=Enterobacteriaceae TaxID=543 RepID=UPI00090333CA|nr:MULTISPECIES: cold-shock protein [Enterobacteriaceae]MCZ3383530.1 cold-shock protein [Kosakonia sp. SOY2]MDZ7323328.1 cold-shock protein [Kosakonia sacchari]PDO88914.1 cold-shock protein [Kosakonia sacchari]
MINRIHFRCPCCHGSQYRISSFDITEKNPAGAKCIFCKSAMTTFDNIAAFVQASQAPLEFRK